MISPAFASLLASGRAQFNARAAEARRRFPSLDMAAFGAFLLDGVDPLIVAVVAAAPERAGGATLAAYDMALELVGHGLAGPAAKNPFLNTVWRELAPQFAPLLATAPIDVLGMLSNAAIHIASVAGARPAQWQRELAALAPQVATLAQLRAVGQVLAWRAGVAHFRQGALAAADTLPPDLALAAFGEPGAPWPQVRAQLLDYPWRGNAEGREFGSFTGLGGDFGAPPQVRAAADGFIVRSGERHYLLVADAFGAVLHSATAQEFEQGQTGMPASVRLDGTTLQIGARRIELDVPTGDIAIAANAHTVAVTSPWTHAIRLLPLA
ncbi:hypothetical protein JAB5_04620 [Janthinobacterium sp. HH103]|uniref:hypothetical protein n=1 Tax=unclassified Janthinobacterium TaxID=2610881 RepID=UPI000873DAAE|nr:MULTISPECIES: hypothetical protein [unclassified Janthinobacterium]OEZ57157.1 hypothetical protein JAB2_50450 [Janthinobacterium sp. HH100]OEZ87132.1 hypothetical protein JAB5_04620 [Janthinobacterium sp. HH103]QOU72986.1 hypothetical protein JAB4_024390 [Janthinobacterium sp. HH102]